jgi:hypothetical protein
MCALFTVFTNGESTEQFLSNIRIETEKKADTYRTASAVLYYDCSNSSPPGIVFALPGEAIGERIVRRQYAVCDEGEFDVKGIKKLTGGSVVHHVEVTLGGVIPYNG